MTSYGGFWRRFLAYFIDAIVINIASAIVGFVIGLVLGVGMTSAGTGSDAIQLMSGAAGGVSGLLVSWLYSAVMESSASQATLGKMALGMVVTDEHGARISFGRATGRYFAKILSGLILLIGFFMIGWTDRKRGLHDMIAGTLVFKARNPQEVGVDLNAFR